MLKKAKVFIYKENRYLNRFDNNLIKKESRFDETLHFCCIFYYDWLKYNQQEGPAYKYKLFNKELLCLKKHFYY